MPQIKLGQDETLVFDSVLTQAQVAKFNGLAKGIIVVGTSPYLRLDELHGVLFTQSKQAAKDLVMNHNDLVRPYLVTDKVLFDNIKPKLQSAIKPMGVYLLLEYLAEINPRKALHYRAGLGLLALILANHPQLMVASLTAGHQMDQQSQAVMDAMKQQHKICQLTGVPFAGGQAKHVHHIECASLNPGLAAEPSNLVVIHEWVHDEYHQWTAHNKLPVCRATIGLYAIKKGFSTPFVQALKAC